MEELRTQVIDLAMDRAFLGEPLPTDERGFKARLDEGRARLAVVGGTIGCTRDEAADAPGAEADFRHEKSAFAEPAVAHSAPGAARFDDP
jgi:hypothetical protein